MSEVSHSSLFTLSLSTVYMQREHWRVAQTKEKGKGKSSATVTD